MHPGLGRVAVLALAASLIASPVALSQEPATDEPTRPVCVVLLPDDGPPASPRADSVAPASPGAAASPSVAPSPATDIGATMTEAVRSGAARLEVVDASACLEEAPASPSPPIEASATDPPATEPPSRRDGDAGRASRGTPYPRFIARAVQAAVELAALADATGAREGLDEVIRASRRLETWARSQRRWLERHPPQRCYAGVHRRWLRAITKVENGAVDLRAGIRGLDAKRAGRGARRIATGAARVADADLEAATRRCSEAAAAA